MSLGAKGGGREWRKEQRNTSSGECAFAQGRTPLDLLSKGLKAYLTSGGTSTEVYTWGNGANYQLGTGAEGLQLVPYRVENLHGEDIAALAAAKFHSAAVARDGRLFTWGFGRGGRLGERCTHQ